jgi:glucokinase
MRRVREGEEATMTAGPQGDGEETASARGAAMLATDLGGTRMRVAVYDASGEQRHHDAGPTQADDPTALARAMRAAVEASPLPISGAVVGIAGPIDYDRAEPRTLPNLPAWEGHISAQRLADAVGVPVILANDADLAALGEQRFGAGVGAQDLVYLTASTGVGGGVVLRGRLLHSRYSLAEVGHTVIDRATGESVEQLGSGTALARLSGEDPAAISARAAAGDAQAAALFREVADAFSLGVLNLALSFMPERVVIGGGMSQAGELLLGPVRERIAAGPAVLPLRPEDVVLATGGDDVGLRGAYALWLDLIDPARPLGDLAMVTPAG